MKNSISLTLNNDGYTEVITASANTMIELPRVAKEGKTFLGWNCYPVLTYGFMNYLPYEDTTLYAIYTDQPSYIVESYYRGDVNDYTGRKAHFRRYVVDIYLENVKAKSGHFRINNSNSLFYYLGYVPTDGITVSVNATTNTRGDAYTDSAFFTTSDIVVDWKSNNELDTTCSKHRIVRLMLAFSKWGLGYAHLARLTSDEVLNPAYEDNATAGDNTAYISANFYTGVRPMEIFPAIEKDEKVVSSEQLIIPQNPGELLARFAVLSDSHIGVRYKWENYKWLYNTYEDIEKIHSETPLDFVLQLGDNIDDGYAATYRQDYDIYLSTIERLRICDAANPIEGREEGKVPHYEMQGNHDTSLDTRFFRNKLWFTESKSGKKVAYIGFFVNYGGYPAVNYTVAGTYKSYRSYGVISEETITFIEESIAEAKEKDAQFIVLCSHFGIAQDLVAPILPESGLGRIGLLCKQSGIKLYLSGHEHNIPYTLRKYNDVYNYDAAMTHDRYAVCEIWENCVLMKIYDTAKRVLVRTDLIDLTDPLNFE